MKEENKMARIQIRNAMFMFSGVWLWVIAAAVHLWRDGEHFTGGFTFIYVSALCILGVIALMLARRDLPKEGSV